MLPALKRLLPHVLILLSFVIASIAYFHPVLSGKKMRQNDIVQYTGMARQQTNFRNQTGEEPYWADNAFGGMPTYQMGAQFPHHYIKKLDRLIRFLPRPADYLFLYFVGFYVLLLILRVEYKLAFIGSLAFGFSTYFIIILGVGHNAKAHAIGYMPLVLSGILLTFRRNYIWGFLLLAVSMALEIAANHFQMTYYLFLLVLALGIAYLVDAYQKKELPHFFKSVGVMVGAVCLSILLNATTLLATKEYTKYSTRGTTGLTIEPNGAPKKTTGLDYSYITEYSYGILESFNLFIPRFMGGASVENVGTDSNIYKELLKLGVSPSQAASIVSYAPTYWGAQPIVGGVAYIGATVIFLFVFALFLVRGRLKWWIVAGTILTLCLSWGKNFSVLTNLFIEYFPMYNKFRAVSSIQVIVELCLPLLAIIGVHKLLDHDIDKQTKLKALKYSLGIVGGIALFFLLFKSMLFDFSGPTDKMLIDQGGPSYLRAVKEDRKAIFTYDTLRSLVLVLLVGAGIWAFLQNKLKKNGLFVVVGVLFLFDLVGIAHRYVNTDNFIAARAFSKPFEATTADKEIMKDTEHYRVYDLSGGPFNSGRASYFHNALGGYHAAKLGRIQDIYDFYLTKGDVGILNMFNVKYFIIRDEEGVHATKNTYANGNAWFVKKLQFAANADEEILALKTLENKEAAVVNHAFKSTVPSQEYTVDSLATIRLVSHQPNHLVYESTNAAAGFAVFSEVYYKDGWQAYIDDQPVAHVQANYILRGLPIPAGTHTISFRFDPPVVYVGSSITLISAIVLILLFLAALWWTYKQRKQTPAGIA